MPRNKPSERDGLFSSLAAYRRPECSRCSVVAIGRCLAGDAPVRVLQGDRGHVPGIALAVVLGISLRDADRVPEIEVVAGLVATVVVLSV